MRTGLCLTRPSQSCIAYGAMGERFRLLAQALCLFGKPFFQVLNLGESSPALHVLLLQTLPTNLTRPSSYGSSICFYWSFLLITPISPKAGTLGNLMRFSKLSKKLK